MIKFPKDATYGDVYGPAMKIRSKKKAAEYLKALVAHIMKDAEDAKYKTPEGALALAKSNLGYYAGYYDHATMTRVYKLFSTQHPIFGKTVPTMEEAFLKGQELGEKLRKGKKC